MILAFRPEDKASIANRHFSFTPPQKKKKWRNREARRKTEISPHYSPALPPGRFAPEFSRHTYAFPDFSSKHGPEQEKRSFTPSKGPVIVGVPPAH
ncbi:hypothetical protein EVAR_33134_1 [Eumeta japonica]|uniref:Uncharacterized protein n=1 Tax=Eumeta variegata TaxID=151549 RepID=A0A4C1Y669_EUMVA|nr:hypothetical protein EVAR_33134_1 [Eumeta japonica]